MAFSATRTEMLLYSSRWLGWRTKKLLNKDGGTGDFTPRTFQQDRTYPSQKGMWDKDSDMRQPDRDQGLVRGLTESFMHHG